MSLAPLVRPAPRADRWFVRPGPPGVLLTTAGRRAVSSVSADAGSGSIGLLDQKIGRPESKCDRPPSRAFRTILRMASSGVGQCEPVTDATDGGDPTGRIRVGLYLEADTAHVLCDSGAALPFLGRTPDPL